MPYTAFGVSGQSNAITALRSPASHVQELWGAVEQQVLQAPASLGAGVVNTANQAFWVNPFPYIWVYDVYVWYTGSGTGGTHSADIFNNGISGGARISSLTGPILLNTGVTTTVTSVSARFQNTPVYNMPADPYLVPSYWTQNIGVNNPNVYARGSVFSLRAVTPGATGSLANLTAVLLYVPSDMPFDYK